MTTVLRPDPLVIELKASNELLAKAASLFWGLSLRQLQYMLEQGFVEAKVEHRPERSYKQYLRDEYASGEVSRAPPRTVPMRVYSYVGEMSWFEMMKAMDAMDRLTRPEFIPLNTREDAERAGWTEPKLTEWFGPP